MFDVRSSADYPTPVLFVMGPGMSDAADWLSLDRAGFRWRLKPGAPEGLVEQLLELRAGERAGAEVVKENPVRMVFRVQCGGETFYAKWHRVRGSWDGVGARLRGTRAEREMAAAMTLADGGVPTIEPVLVALRRRFGLPVESFLVTRELSGVSLCGLARGPSASRSRADQARRLRLARALGRSVRRLHDSGISHPDLHPGNFLVTGDDELAILDLHAAKRVGRFPAFCQRVRDIAKLQVSMDDPAITVRDRVRFARAYLGDDAAREELSALLYHAYNYAGYLREKHIRSRSRRCVVKSKVYTNERTSLGRVFRKRAMPLEAVAKALALHRRVLAGEAEGEVLKSARKTNVTFVPMDGSLGVERLCVKEWVRPALAMLLPKRLRHRPAMRSWRASLGLAVRGVPAPEAHALVMGRGRRSYVIMEALRDGAPLPVYVERIMTPELPAATRRAFASAAACFLLKCYAECVRHKDLKAANVLVREMEPGAWRFYLLDLDAVRFPRHIRMEWKLVNLAQLNAAVSLKFTWTDRMRFLRCLARDDPSLLDRAVAREIGRLTLGRGLRWRA